MLVDLTKTIFSVSVSLPIFAVSVAMKIRQAIGTHPCARTERRAPKKVGSNHGIAACAACAARSSARGKADVRVRRTVSSGSGQHDLCAGRRARVVPEVCRRAGVKVIHRWPWVCLAPRTSAGICTRGSVPLRNTCSAAALESALADWRCTLHITNPCTTNLEFGPLDSGKLFMAIPFTCGYLREVTKSFDVVSSAVGTHFVQLRCKASCPRADVVLFSFSGGHPRNIII